MMKVSASINDKKSQSFVPFINKKRQDNFFFNYDNVETPFFDHVNQPVPQQKKNRQQDMTQANSEAVALIDGSIPRLERLRDLVQKNQLDKATKQDAHTLHVVRHYLKIDPIKDISTFLDVMKDAISLVKSNQKLKKVQLKYKPNCTDYANAIPGDPNQIINCCDLFFNTGPKCRRNVIIHERFHLVGIGHGEDAKGKIPKQKDRTTAQALNSAYDMTDIVVETMNKDSYACSKKI